MLAMTRDRVHELARPHLGTLVDTAVANVRTGRGGPFAAMVLDSSTGAIIALGANSVTTTHDPTAHAEVSAVRDAARALGTEALHGHVLVASCEPCPMCLAACMWSRLDAVAWLATRDDAAAAGFDDSAFDLALGTPDPLPEHLAALVLVHLADPRAQAPFAAWASYADRVPY